MVKLKGMQFDGLLLDKQKKGYIAAWVNSRALSIQRILDMVECYAVISWINL